MQHLDDAHSISSCSHFSLSMRQSSLGEVFSSYTLTQPVRFQLDEL